MTAYGVFAASTLGTAEDKADVELGSMQAWIAPVGVPGEGFWQAPTQPLWNGYPAEPGQGWVVPEGDPVEDPTAFLPAGTESLLIAEGSARVETRAGLGLVPAWTGDTWDPRFAGAFDLVDGARPTGPDEAMVTPATLERLGVGIGGDLVLADGTATFEIVGTLDAGILRDEESAVFLPGTAAVRALVGGDQRWYLPDLALTWDDVQALNEEGVVAYSREVMLDPPTQLREEVKGSVADSWSMMWQTVLVASAGGLFAAYVVVMLAGAAFAVAARRQQRSLAVAASVGADRRDLSRTILLQGTALGAVGGLAGVVLGIGLAALIMTLTADGSAIQFWGFHVPWPALAAIFVFAVAVGTASALVPARTVALTDALSALRGARRPQKPKGARPVWGSIVLVAGVGVTIACAFIVAAVNASDLPWDSPWRYIPAYGIVIGPILAQIGILMSGRWLLWVTARGLSRVGLAARLAARDAAANAGRTVPAFAAIAATVFIGVFAVAQSSMQTAQNARNHYYQAPLGTVAISVWPGWEPTTGEVEAEDAGAGAAAARELAADAGATDAAVVARQQGFWAYASESQVPDDAVWVMAVLPEEHLLDPEVQDTWIGADPDNPLSVIDPSELETALGTDLSPAQLDAYREGAALVADERFVTDGTVEIGAWAGADHYAGRTPFNIWIRDASAPAVADPLREERVDAIVVDAPLQPVTIAVAPATAERLGMAATPERVVATFAEQPTTVQRDRMQAEAELRSGGDFTLGVAVEDGPPSDLPWLVPLLAVVAVLVLGASAVALGLARFERRPDDATLAAVGGTRSLRRRIAFWQGLVIAGFGTLAGAAAGILPPIGFAIQSQGNLLLGDVRWALLGVFCLGLPLAIALANVIVPPRHPDLTRRTAIT
ncbi:ABC transporter permease [Microbacterium hominis]|uniref:ABC transporter permease n=2 Tax=Microbacterium hominis TaxID=162426 RepID=A0A7D4TQH0_9MICO|nr:ABC transporter permease [Microbacterium hominis]